MMWARESDEPGAGWRMASDDFGDIGESRFLDRQGGSCAASRVPSVYRPQTPPSYTFFTVDEPPTFRYRVQKP
jgi:hypothetical protein